MKRCAQFVLLLSLVLFFAQLKAQPVTSAKIVTSLVADSASVKVSVVQPESKLLGDTVGYQWISYKAKVDFTGDKLNNSCQLFFVNKIDSIIYLNFHVSGVEIMRVVMTPELVTLVNKLDHAYYQGDYSIFSKLAGVRADFYFIQALFNKCDFRDFEDNLQFVNDEQAIWRMVSPLRRHKSTDWSIMQKVDMNPLTGELKNEITDLVSGQVVSATYLCDTTAHSSRYGTMMLDLPLGGLKVTLTTRNVKYNVPGPTSARIPEKFSRLIFD